MTVLVETSYPYFTDSNNGGVALEAGYIYIGEENKDPESKPITTYWSKEPLANPTGQPIRTIAGHPSYNGTPGNIYIFESNYSMTVRDKNKNLISTELSRAGSTIGGTTTAIAGAPPNRVISGAVRTNSEYPNFLDFDGSGPNVTILGDTTNLKVSINDIEVTISTDILTSGLTVAPSANNTCLVNDSTLTDQLSSKYTGEDDSILNIDTAGSEITSRIGQVVALQKNGGTEIMLAFVKSATQLTNVYRGFFYDSSSDPIVRETLADGDQLNILSLGWLFIESDGLTTDVTYKSPTYSYTQPSGTVGDYWFDMSLNVWKRFAASWVTIDRTLIGMVAIGTAVTVGKRETDFYYDYRDTNTVALEVFSDEIIRSKDKTNNVFAYSGTLRIDPTKITWDNTSDMETGSVASSTTYYLYMASTGQRVVSLEKYYTRNDLRGRYHPYEAWRYIGNGVTDATSDWSTTLSEGSQLGDSAPLSIGPTDRGSSINKASENHSHSIVSEISTKTDDYTILATDRGKMIELGSATAAAKTFTFDSLGSDEDGYIWTISNDSDYNLTVAVSDTDHIWNSGAGYGVDLPNKGTIILLQYDHATTKLNILPGKTGGKVLIEGLVFHEPMQKLGNVDVDTSTASSNKLELTERHSSLLVNGVDLNVGKFVPGSYRFNGSDEYMSIIDSADWDVLGTLTGHKTVSGWFYTDTVAASLGTIVSQYEDASNNWQLLRSTAALRFLYNSAVATNIDISGGTLTVDTWHHIALILYLNMLGLYIDGVQVAYSLFEADTFTGSLFFAQNGASANYHDGRLQDWQISFNNPYGATPNSTPDDTFSSPETLFQGVML
jgi:hypothetical protein